MLKLSLAAVVGTGFIYSGWKTFFMFRSTDLSILDRNAKLLDALSETIIPQTDSVGASGAKVYSFILLNIKENTTRVNQNNFIDGLQDLIARTHSLFGHSFEECTFDQREEILTYYEHEGKTGEGTIGKVQAKIFGFSFFHLLKKLTVQGYCTSKEGMMQGLAYNAIPGKYISCQPLLTKQKVWATR